MGFLVLARPEPGLVVDECQTSCESEALVQHPLGIGYSIHRIGGGFPHVEEVSLISPGKYQVIGPLVFECREEFNKIVMASTESFQSGNLSVEVFPTAMPNFFQSKNSIAKLGQRQ